MAELFLLKRIVQELNDLHVNMQNSKPFDQRKLDAIISLPPEKNWMQGTDR